MPNQPSSLGQYKTAKLRVNKLLLKHTRYYFDRGEQHLGLRLSVGFHAIFLQNCCIDRETAFPSKCNDYVFDTNRFFPTHLNNKHHLLFAINRKPSPTPVNL